VQSTQTELLTFVYSQESNKLKKPVNLFYSFIKIKYIKNNFIYYYYHY
jgi:hypothetical protein